MLSIKQGGIKYHFLSLWYDTYVKRLWLMWRTQETKPHEPIRAPRNTAGVWLETRGSVPSLVQELTIHRKQWFHYLAFSKSLTLAVYCSVKLMSLSNYAMYFSSSSVNSNIRVTTRRNIGKMSTITKYSIDYFKSFFFFLFHSFFFYIVKYFILIPLISPSNCNLLIFLIISFILLCLRSNFNITFQPCNWNSNSLSTILQSGTLATTSQGSHPCVFIWEVNNIESKKETGPSYKKDWGLRNLLLFMWSLDCV